MENLMQKKQGVRSPVTCALYNSSQHMKYEWDRADLEPQKKKDTIV